MIYEDVQRSGESGLIDNGWGSSEFESYDEQSDSETKQPTRNKVGNAWFIYPYAVGRGYLFVRPIPGGGDCSGCLLLNRFIMQFRMVTALHTSTEKGIRFFWVLSVLFPCWVLPCSCS